MRTIVCLLLLAGLVGVAYAEDKPGEPKPAPAEEPKMKRGFEAGKFVDDYFGIRYEAEGLEKGFSIGGPNVLFAGRLPEGVDVEVALQEAPKTLEAAKWFEMFKAGKAKDGKTRTDMEEGSDPQPWILFVQESLAGFKRHHGYAFYARGPQCFIVHAQVREKSDKSGDSIKAALKRLQVKADAEPSYLYVHVVSKKSGKALDDPLVWAQAAEGYLQDGPMKNPARALELSLKAKAKAADFPPDAKWQVTSRIGLAQLLTGKVKEAIPTWKEAIELAKSTSQPEGLGANSHYNMACAYSLDSQLDEAFAHLKKSFDMGLADQVAMLKKHAQGDPDLENMRKDERWKELFGGAKTGGDMGGEK